MILYLEAGQIVILGGDPRGGCALHKTLAKKAGWKRSRKRGELSDGSPCSVFTAPLYPHTAKPALRLTQHKKLFVSPEDLKTLKIVANSLETAKEILEANNHYETAFPLKRRLFRHQSSAVRCARLMGFKCMIADEMGLGKTATALACWADSRCYRLLVVCPASVKYNWEREVREVLGEDVRCFVIDGTKKKRKQILREMVTFPEGVSIVNYDLLPFMDDEAVQILRGWADQFVILDESHYIKSKDAKRTKWVREHLAGARYRMALTGTPVRNMIDDLYTQADYLRPGMWASYGDFCRRYLVQARVTMGGRSFFKTRGTRNSEELNQLVNTFQIRRRKEDAFDLPPKVRTVTLLELDDSTRRIYEAMRSFALLSLSELDESTSMFEPKAASALEAALRCEQIAQGFVGGIPEQYMAKVVPLLVGHAERIPGREKELIFPKSAKIQFVRERIEDILQQGGSPVVIGNYNAPLFYLHKQYANSSLLHGGMNAKQRDDEIQRFQTGKTDIMFCQVKVAIGFDLTRSHDVIFLGRDESPAVNAQAEDRCHRIGTKGTVNIQIPVVTKTIEEKNHKRLDLKAGEAERAIRNMTAGQLREIL